MSGLISKLFSNRPPVVGRWVCFGAQAFVVVEHMVVRQKRRIDERIEVVPSA